MKSRLFAATVAGVVLLVLAGGVGLLAASYLSKEALPTFPASFDDGRPLPIPSMKNALGPAVATPQTVEVPADLIDVEKPVQPQKDKAGLEAYRGSRASALRALPVDRSSMARITFRSGMLPDEALALLAAHEFVGIYVEWELLDSFEHGGTPVWQLDQVRAEQPGLLVVHAAGWGNVAGLQDLAMDPHVWLVDPAGTQDFYWSAKSAGALSE
ncbi:MAG: hypothetical protein HYX55_01210 [Chloroflexi bacterium]|nr:hypothetical protein [Chloroflexota bacterium]